MFEQNKTELQAMDSLYLEDFVDSSTFQIQEKLERLNLSVSVAYSPVYTHEEFYSRAVKGLKRTAPNLKTVGLYGTLRMYPRIMVNVRIVHLKHPLFRACMSCVKKLWKSKEV